MDEEDHVSLANFGKERGNIDDGLIAKYDAGPGHDRHIRHD
jgi:hypothetical protein